MNVLCLKRDRSTGVLDARECITQNRVAPICPRSSCVECTCVSRLSAELCEVVPFEHTIVRAAEHPGAVITRNPSECPRKRITRSRSLQSTGRLLAYVLGSTEHCVVDEVITNAVCRHKQSVRPGKSTAKGLWQIACVHTERDPWLVHSLPEAEIVQGVPRNHSIPGRQSGITSNPCQKEARS